MIDKIIELMQPVFHIGDILGGYIEDMTKYTAEGVAIFLVILDFILFSMAVIIDFSIINFITVLIVGKCAYDDYNRKQCYKGNTMYKIMIRQTSTCISMFICTLMYLGFTIYLLNTIDGLSGVLIVLSTFSCFVSDILYVANPIPPEKNYKTSPI